MVKLERRHEIRIAYLISLRAEILSWTAGLSEWRDSIRVHSLIQ